MGLARLGLAVLMLSALAACSRPVGDFGRVAVDTPTDRVMVALKHANQNIPGAPFNYTDEETEMENRIWRFFRAIHDGDWAYHSTMEAERGRHRVGKPYDLDTSRYYRYLQRNEFRSSRVRYNSVAREIDADLGTLPETFTAICKVIEIDERRQTALQSFSDFDETTREQVRRRRWENARTIDWFAVVLAYRYDQYTYALKHLLVETPHERAREVDERMSRLAVWVDRAQSSNFCVSGNVDAAYAGGGSIPSRFATQPFTPEPVYRK